MLNDDMKQLIIFAAPSGSGKSSLISKIIEQSDNKVQLSVSATTRPARKGEINGKIAKELFEIVYSEGGEPAEIVDKRGMKQVTDTVAIEKAVAEIISANPDQVEKAKLNPKLIGWFVGQVMKATGGKANPKTVNELVAAKLNS